MEVVRQEIGKVCLACRSSLPLTAFGKKASARDGLNPQCIPCTFAILGDSSGWEQIS